MCIYVFICTYIHIQRERARERALTQVRSAHTYIFSRHTCNIHIYIYKCIQIMYINIFIFCTVYMYVYVLIAIVMVFILLIWFLLPIAHRQLHLEAWSAIYDPMQVDGGHITCKGNFELSQALWSAQYAILSSVRSDYVHHGLSPGGLATDGCSVRFADWTACS